MDDAAGAVDIDKRPATAGQVYHLAMIDPTHPTLLVVAADRTASVVAERGPANSLSAAL